MNNFSNLAAVSLTPSIVLPVLRSVNHSAGNSIPDNDIIRVDGWPLPPLPPRIANKQFADGWPLPPLPPRIADTLFADGWPLPPLPPKRKSLTTS